MFRGGKPELLVNWFVSNKISSLIPCFGINTGKESVSPGCRLTSGIKKLSTENKLVGCTHSLARVDTTNVPGATTSGLNRPDAPSRRRPMLPVLENEATSLLLSVIDNQGWVMLVTPSSITVTRLVMLRMFSNAP